MVREEEEESPLPAEKVRKLQQGKEVVRGVIHTYMRGACQVALHHFLFATGCQDWGI